MPGGEQAGWAVVGAAAIATLGSIIDRLLSRFRPRPRRASMATLESERVELAREWAEYRREVNGQLVACRVENNDLRSKLDTMQITNGELRAEIVSLRLDVSQLTARLDSR